MEQKNETGIKTVTMGCSVTQYAYHAYKISTKFVNYSRNNVIILTSCKTASQLKNLRFKNCIYELIWMKLIMHLGFIKISKGNV